MLACTLAIGCAPQDADTSPRPAAADADYMTLYQQGRFAAARTAALNHAKVNIGDSRDQAKLIAGLCAYQLGRNEQALSDLTHMADHRTDELGATAAAIVGLIRMRDLRHESAQQYLRLASIRSRGTDKAFALYYLAITQQRMGRWAPARTNLRHAASESSNSRLLRAIRYRQNVEHFAIQLGAYSQIRTAEARVRTTSQALRQAGVDTPKMIASRTDTGQQLYLVQAGRFDTYDQARMHQRRAALRDSAVVPVSRR